MKKSRPSSQLVEFVIAIAVGLLAILGGLLCVGFLLVDPVRNPKGVGETKPLPDYDGILLNTCMMCVYCSKVKYSVGQFITILWKRLKLAFSPLATMYL